MHPLWFKCLMITELGDSFRISAVGIRLWILNCRSEHRALASYMYVLLRLHDGQSGALFVPQYVSQMWDRPLPHQVSVQAMH